MPWELQIHQIDVEQGESTLLIATDGTAANTRTMLIDAGLPGMAATVHSYVKTQLTALSRRPGFGAPANHVNVLVVSHFDADHSGGIENLLIADCFTQQAEIIGRAAALGADLAKRARASAAQRTLAAMASASVAVLGGNDYAQGQAAENASRVSTKKARTPVEMSMLAWKIATKLRDKDIDGQKGRFDAPIVQKTTGRGKRVAREVGLVFRVASATEADAVTQARQSLRSAITAGARFSTKGYYQVSRIYDNGTSVPQSYLDAIGGTITLGGNFGVNIPSVARTRTIPNLGAELLWAPDGAPANAPRVYVEAINQAIRNTAQLIPGDSDNNASSIGLIVRFNNFYFYTAGDLTSPGDEAVATDLLTNGTPDGGRTDHLCAIKCGHHGASTSTSAAFLAAARPNGALISCGYNGSYKHPANVTISNITSCTATAAFYLTNCNFLTPDPVDENDEDSVNQAKATLGAVPASFGDDQLNPPNPPYSQPNLASQPGGPLDVSAYRSRVAGDNHSRARGDPQPHTHRGDIALFVSEDNSHVAAGQQAVAGGPNHQYQVRYWDEDAPHGANQRFITVTHRH